MMSEPCLNISRLVKALCEQSIESFPSCRSPERSGKGTPFWRNFGIGRPAIQVNQALRFCDCLLVKRCNSRRKGVDEFVELGVRQRTIDISVQRCEVTVNIVRT